MLVLMTTSYIDVSMKIWIHAMYATHAGIRSTMLKLSCPTGRAKRCVDAKINTLESEGKCSPSMKSEPSVPVNLTC